MNSKGVVPITGFARALAERGANVALFDVDGTVAETNAEALRKCGIVAIAWQCDVTDELRVSKLVAEVVAKFGTVDILITSDG